MLLYVDNSACMMCKVILVYSNFHESVCSHSLTLCTYEYYRVKSKVKTIICSQCFQGYFPQCEILLTSLHFQTLRVMKASSQHDLVSSNVVTDGRHESNMTVNNQKFFEERYFCRLKFG